MSVDNWEISQIHRCLLVFNTTELSYSNVSLAYNSDLGSKAIYPGTSFVSWDELFGNSDAEYCGITSCQIYDSGKCGNDTYSGSNLVMDENSPWDIEASLS